MWNTSSSTIQILRFSLLSALAFLIFYSHPAQAIDQGVFSMTGDSLGYDTFGADNSLSLLYQATSTQYVNAAAFVFNNIQNSGSGSCHISLVVWHTDNAGVFINEVATSTTSWDINNYGAFEYVSAADIMAGNDDEPYNYVPWEFATPMLFEQNEWYAFKLTPSADCGTYTGGASARHIESNVNSNTRYCWAHTASGCPFYTFLDTKEVNVVLGFNFFAGSDIWSWDVPDNPAQIPPDAFHIEDTGFAFNMHNDCWIQSPEDCRVPFMWGDNYNDHWVGIYWQSGENITGQAPVLDYMTMTDRQNQGDNFLYTDMEARDLGNNLVATGTEYFTITITENTTSTSTVDRSFNNVAIHWNDENQEETILDSLIEQFSQVFPLSIAYQLDDLFRDMAQNPATSTIAMPLNTLLPDEMHISNSVNVISGTSFNSAFTFWHETVYHTLEWLIHIAFMVLLAYIVWPKLKTFI